MSSYGESGSLAPAPKGLSEGLAELLLTSAGGAELVAPPWPWIARVALLPIMVLAIGLLWVVGAGLWNGEIHAISKSSKGMVSRLTSAVGYWFAVAYHSFVATFIAYFAMQVLRFSLPRKQPK